MQRLALVVVPVVLLIGCREFNPESCKNPDNANMPPCGMLPVDGPPIDASCMDDTACGGGTPVCKITPELRECVQCTPEKRAACTDPKMPICTNNKCAPCTQHADCTESKVCKLDGSCADATEVAYVDGTTGTDPADCSKATPCTKIEKAVMTGKAIVKVSGTVTNASRIDNKNATIFADPGAALTPSMDAIALEVAGNSKVQIYDLAISQPANAMAKECVKITETAELELIHVSVSNSKLNGINADGKKFTCTRCTIELNSNLGINATKGTIVISQSTIKKNLDGGIAVNGMDTEFQIVGNVIFDNGGDTSGTGGINVVQVKGVATNRIDFNSISRNEAGNFIAPGVKCLSTLMPLTARYNIIYDNGPSPSFGEQVSATGCDHKLSDIGPTAFGTMNVNTPPGFMDEQNGDLRLRKPLETQLFVNASTAELTGLAARDIENELRTTDTVMGADHVSR
jgi:hypothetical protein